MQSSTDTVIHTSSSFTVPHLRAILLEILSCNNTRLTEILHKNIIPQLVNQLVRNETDDSLGLLDFGITFLVEESEDDGKKQIKRKQIIVYCLRILLQLLSRSELANWKGTLNDSDFAVLLQSALFSGKHHASYAGWIILEQWIKSENHDQLFSNLTLPSSFLSPLSSLCPSMKKIDSQEEEDWFFFEQLLPYVSTLVPPLVVISEAFRLGMHFTAETMKQVSSLLSTATAGVADGEKLLSCFYQTPYFDLFHTMAPLLTSLLAGTAAPDVCQREWAHLVMESWDNQRNTVLHLLAASDDPFAANELASLLASTVHPVTQLLGWVSNYGAIPLWIAMQLKRRASTEVLLKRMDEEDINASNRSGITPLAFAAENGDVELAKLLIDHKADVNKPAADGLTPLTIAVENQHSDVADLLTSHGAR